MKLGIVASGLTLVTLLLSPGAGASTPAPFHRPAPHASALPTVVSSDRLGLTVRNLSTAERSRLNVPQGGLMVASLVEGSGQRAGLRPGDVVLMVNGVPVISAEQLHRLERDLPRGQPVPVLIHRDDSNQFVAITLDR